MAVVGVGGGLASSLAALKQFPTWLPPAVAIGFAGLAVLYTQYIQPRKASELRSDFIKAMFAAVLGGAIAMAVGKSIALAF